MAPFSLVQIFFLSCALLGGLLFILRLALSFFAGEAADFDLRPAHPDHPEVRHHGEGRLPVVSQQGVAALVAFFGLAGLALSRAGIPAVWAILAGLLAGAGAMLVVAWLHLSMQRVRSDGLLRIENTISKQGIVTQEIPLEGSGRVSLAERGALTEFDAITNGSQPLPVGTRVRVVRVKPGRVLVVEGYA